MINYDGFPDIPKEKATKEQPQPTPKHNNATQKEPTTKMNDVCLHASWSEPELVKNVESAIEPGKKIKGEILRNRKPSKNKTRRGISKREIKRKNKLFSFILLGNNANGLSGKVDSLKNTLKSLKPSCITIQETKLKSKKFDIPGYQVFLKNRPGLGGGLLTAIDENLAPVLVSSPDTEILVVQTKVREP